MHLSAFLLSLPLVSAFTHPGLLVNDADIARIKTKLAAGKEPWTSSYSKLKGLKFSQTTWESEAVPIVWRDNEGSNTANAELLWHDAAAAFNLGLRWKIEGDAQYAAAAAEILTSWGNTLTALGDGAHDDDYLTAGFQGYEMANAGELIRDYVPFANGGGLANFTRMLETVFLAKNVFFLNHQAPSEHNHLHFFANWELGQVASVLAIGVLTDNQTTYDFGINYFKTGSGNGALLNAINPIVQEPGTGNPLGQGQESGRDQGHSALDQQILASIAQQAWNQGDDLYGLEENRILLGAEYFARYNLGNDVPFVNYTNNIVSFNQISSASRGAIRPNWELLYSHYAQIKGVDAPWTAEYLNNTLEYFGGFEGGAGSWGEGSGHYDGLGWGSLLYRLDEEDVVATAGPSSTSSSSAVLSAATTSAIATATTQTESLTPVPASSLVANTSASTAAITITTTSSSASVQSSFAFNSTSITTTASAAPSSLNSTSISIPTTTSDTSTALPSSTSSPDDEECEADELL